VNPETLTVNLESYTILPTPYTLHPWDPNHCRAWLLRERYDARSANAL